MERESGESAVMPVMLGHDFEEIVVASDTQSAGPWLYERCADLSERWAREKDAKVALKLSEAVVLVAEGGREAARLMASCLVEAAAKLDTESAEMEEAAELVSKVVDFAGGWHCLVRRAA